MNRSSMRELAFKAMYGMEIQKEYTKEQLELFLEDNEITDEVAVEYITSVYEGIEKNKGLVKNAVNGLAGDIKTGLKGEINLSSQNATITHVIDDYKNNKEKNNRFIQVNLQVGTKTIASTLVDDLGKIISKKQGARGITKGVLSNI